MRIIETKVYNHSDLLLPENKDVLNNIVKNWDNDYYYIWDEAHKSVKGFHKFFNFSSEGNRNWLDWNFNYESSLLNDFEISEMFGNDLKEWFLENFNQDKIFECCPFTGVAYDETLLTPFRSFLLGTYKDFESTNLRDLIDDAFNSLRSEIESEIEYRNSEEAILEDISANDYEFFEDGKMA